MPQGPGERIRPIDAVALLWALAICAVYAYPILVSIASILAGQ